MHRILKAAAVELGLKSAWFIEKKQALNDPLYNPAEVFIMTKDEDVLETFRLNGWELTGGGGDLAGVRTWTDDYFNILVPIADKRR